MKTGLCITLFHPVETQIDSLISKLECFDFVYIYDNSNDSTGFERKAKLSSNHCRYFYSNNNDGLCVAFNKCCDAALKDGVDLLMFLDQDSSFEKDDITKLFESCEQLLNKTNLGMMGPRIIIKGKKDRSFKNEVEKTEWIITSGSILVMNAYRKVGHFDENYFINYIERDYCLELFKNGYLTFVDNRIVLNQELGEIYSKNNRSILIHSPLRNYYGHRNRLYFLKKQKKYIGIKEKVRLRLASLKDYFVFAFYYPYKKDNLYYINKARKDYKKGLFGKIKS